MQPVIKKVGSAVGGAVVDKLKDVVTDKLQSAFNSVSSAPPIVTGKQLFP